MNRAYCAARRVGTEGPIAGAGARSPGSCRASTRPYTDTLSPRKVVSSSRASPSRSRIPGCRARWNRPCRPCGTCWSPAGVEGALSWRPRLRVPADEAAAGSQDLCGLRALECRGAGPAGQRLPSWRISHAPSDGRARIGTAARQTSVPVHIRDRLADQPWDPRNILEHWILQPEAYGGHSR